MQLIKIHKQTRRFLPLLILSFYVIACGTQNNSKVESGNDNEGDAVRPASYDTIYVYREAFKKGSKKEWLKRKYFGDKSTANSNEVLDEPLEIIGGSGKLLNKVGYPPRLRVKGISGKSVVEFVISPEGEATNIKIIESLHPILDEKIVVALLNTQFKPGLLNGNPVPVLTELPFLFRLANRSF